MQSAQGIYIGGVWHVARLRSCCSSCYTGFAWDQALLSPWSELGFKWQLLRAFAREFLCGHWNLLGTGSHLITHNHCVRVGGCCIGAFFMIVLMCSSLASSCKFFLLGSVSLLRALLWDANYCIFAAEPFSAMVPWGCLDFGSIWQTWLILPVVICLSQRLSHACLSISFYTAKLRMAH